MYSKLYNPIALSLAELQSGEQHYYSFQVTEYAKMGPICEKKPFSRYYCHVTQQRVILEPIEVRLSEEWIAKAGLGIAGLFVDVPASVSIPLKADLSISKRKSKRGEYAEIPFREIMSFEVIKGFGFYSLAKIVLKHPPKALFGADPHPIFGATSVPERQSWFAKWVYTGNLSEYLVKVANELLRSHNQ